MKSSTYCFHVKTKILADFQICISVPLKRIMSERIRGDTNEKIKCTKIGKAVHNSTEIQ